MNIQKTLLLLQAAGLKQAQIGSEIGCSQSSISDMQNGKIGKKRPAYDLVRGIERLAEKHGVEITDDIQPQSDKVPN